MFDIEKCIELFKKHDKVKFILTGCGERECDTKDFELAIEALEEKINRNAKSIGVALSTDKGLKPCLLTEEMILDLIRAIKEQGTEQVVLSSGDYYQVDGIYIPGKGNKSVIAVLPMEDEE